MKKKKREELLSKVQTAVTEVSDAAGELDRLLAQIKVAPRAQKTTISAVVEEAFSRLSVARVALSEVEMILTKEKDAT